MRKFLLTLLSMICLTAVSFAAEQTATITFKSGTNATQDTPKLSTTSELAMIVDEGTEFFSAVETAKNAFLGKVGKGLKLGTGTANGTLELTFVQPIKITRIVANMATYNVSDGSSVAINDVTNTLDVSDTEFRDYTFDYTSEEEATKLSIGTDKKRVYVKSLTITYDDGQQAEVTYTEPTSDSPSSDEIYYYLTGITSEGAVENLSYSATERTGLYNLVEGLKTSPGSTFTVNFQAFVHGPASQYTPYEDIRYDRAFIFTDFDGDGNWEFVKIIGDHGMTGGTIHYRYGNYDTTLNITEEFTLPETAQVGDKARIRVVYQNAWRTLGAGATDAAPDPNATNLEKGACYDLVIDVVEAPVPTHAVTVEANGATVEFMKDGVAVEDLTAIEEGSVLTFTVTAPEGKIVESVTAGTETLEATEGVYTITVNADVTVTVNLADDVVANMAVSMITRGSYYSSTDSRIEISEELYLTRVYNDWHTTGADDSFTMAGWFKLNAKTSLPGGSVIMGLTAKAHNNINGSLAIGLDTSGNYKLICGDKDSGNRTAVEGSTTTAMTTGEWHYLTLSYDAATLTVKMYADGKELKSGTLAGNLRLFPDNPGIISLGAAQFDGAVDEFQFWGRALAANEVLAAMADAKTVEGLKGFYDFNIGENGLFANAIEAYNFPAQYNLTSGSSNGGDGGTISVSNTASTPSMTEGRSEVVIPQPATYALTIEDNGATVTVMAGETAVDDLSAIAEGTELTVSVEAPAHYTVAAVKLGEEALTANEDGTYTITMDADKTLTVELAAINFGVTVEANGATVVFKNGEEVVEDLTAILEGTELTFTVVAPEGKVVESVKAGEEVLTPSEEGVYTITVDADKTITVTLADAAPVANMAADLFTRESWWSGSDSRVVISEELYLTREYADDVWHTTGADDSFTMAGWFRLDKKTSLAGGTMIMGLTAQAHNNINGSLAIGVDTDGNYKLICGDGTNNADVAGSTTTAMTTEEWHYLTLSYDAATLTVKMYADGKELKSGTLAGNLRLFPDNPGIISLGAAQFDGAVDEFQFWGRALSADEVKAAMLNAKTVEGIKGFYDFNVADSEGKFANAIAGYNYSAQTFNTSGSYSTDGGTTGVINTPMTTPPLTEGRPDMTAPATYAVTVEANGATVEFRNGEEVIEDLSAITAGTELSFTVAAPEYTEVASVTANDVELTATEGVYTFTVTAPTTIVVTLNDLERPNMAVVMPGRTSNTADNRIEISEKLYLTRDYNNSWYTTGDEDSFTMSGWFKITSYTSYPGGAVIMGLGARAHNNVNASLGIGLNSYGNYSVICGDGTNKEGVNVTTDRQMTTNEWHYLTLTYDAASLEMTFYADGEILHKATFGSALRLFPDNPGIITLGAAQFTGAVDEFQFWGRALSGDEIRVAMLDATEISDGLKGLYDFNAGSKGSYANAIAEYEFPAKYYTTVGTSNGGDGGVISVSPIATTPQSTEGRVLADVVAPTVYAVSFQMPEGTTVDAKVNNKAMIDPEQVIAGSTLTFTVATPADKEVDTVEINAAEATATEGVYTATVDTDLDVIITLKETSSIFTIGIDGAEGEIEVFNLNGVRVDADNIVPGIYIVRQGGMTQKVLVK